jgi:hypothetical protein
MLASVTAERAAAAVNSLAPSFDPLVDAQWLVVIAVVALLVWLVALLVFFVVMVRHYTLRDPASWPGGQSPFVGETLAMPRGVFRAVLTVSLLVVVLFMEIVSLTQGGLERHLEQLLVAFQMMLAFYFGGKVMHHIAAVEKTKEELRQKTEQMDVEARAGKLQDCEVDFEIDGAKG